MTQTFRLKLTTLFVHYLEQIPLDERMKILTNLRSAAPLISRIAHWMNKGRIRPTSHNVLPGS